MTDEKIREVLLTMYRRSFSASTPKGDFDEILKNAKVNDFGEKEIPFMDYYCEISKMEDIIEEVLKEFRVPKYLRKRIERSFWLGCSPTSVIIY